GRGDPAVADRGRSGPPALARTRQVSERVGAAAYGLRSRATKERATKEDVASRAARESEPEVWLRRPTTRGLAAFVLGTALGAAGVMWRYPGALVLGGALVLLAVVAALSVLNRAPVKVDRQVWPLEVTRNSPCEARLRLRRRGGIAPLAIDATEYV